MEVEGALCNNYVITVQLLCNYCAVTKELLCITIQLLCSYLLNVTTSMSPLTGVLSKWSLAMAAKVAVQNSTRAQVPLLLIKEFREFKEHQKVVLRT